MDHVPVLLAETLHYLKTKAFLGQPGIFIDATFGGGGHSVAILENTSSQTRLLAIDRDEAAIRRAEPLRERYGKRFQFIKGNFAELTSLLAAAGLFEIDAILFDLGLSSHQLSARERGFSFQLDGPLDMRMDFEAEKTAAEIINHADFEDLRQIFRLYGEEPRAAKIARTIVAQRKNKPFTGTAELAELVCRVTPFMVRSRRLHPATRVFQALRIAVNNELESLRKVLPAALQALRVGGRLVVISYHSLEDRIAKKIFRRWTGLCTCPPDLPVCSCGAVPLVKNLTVKPVVPGPVELNNNPRSRSAKLRAVEKI